MMDIMQIAEELNIREEDVLEVYHEAIRKYEQFERSGRKSDIDLAVVFAKISTRKVDKSDASLPSMLNTLGLMLGRRYERLGEIGDLEEAIEIARQVVDSTLTDNLDRAGRLSNLGNMLQLRYKRKGEIGNLEEAIQIAQLAVDLPLHDYHILAGCLNNLGNALESRYQRIGKISDLEEGIKRAQQAVDYTSKDHPNYAGYLSNLGGKLQLQYEQTGEISNLEAAIKAMQQAINSTPRSHPGRDIYLDSLGNKLASRYERTGEMGDLKEAIKIARQVIDSTPKDHPHRAGRLNNLGNKLASRYKRTREMKDLQEAIEMTQEAVDSTLDYLNRAAYLNNLGSKLQLRYEQTRDLRDLEDAIKTARQAVDSKDHPNHAAYLTNLGSKLQLLYEHTRNLGDLEDAIKTAQHAIDSTPKNHPGLAIYLINLGNKLLTRYERTEEAGDLENASEHFYNAWRCLTAVPFHRIEAAARCVKLLARQGKTNMAIQLGKEVLDLLPSVHTKLMDRNDQQFAIATFAGVAADLCSLLLEMDQPENALRYLEHGRAVIISQLMDRRTDISTLAQSHPNFAQQYKNLVSEVNQPLRSLEHDAVESQVLERRREAVTELEECIKEIRGIEGHQRFLLGQSTVEMQETAAEGSIVVVNITELRGDAIIVSRKTIKTLSLPKLSASDAKTWLSDEWAREPRSQRDSRADEYRRWSLARCITRDAKLVGVTGGNKNDGFGGFLARLWTDCVRLVLEELGYHKASPNQELPRVWWIGTGFASSLPFHAAGDDSMGPTENTLSWAISSYTPTIKALRHAREKAAVDIDKHSVLLVTMRKTPGANDLPGVEAEEKAIRAAVQSPHSVESLAQPCKDTVLAKLGDFSIVHFACHGSSDQTDPSRSFLALQGSSNSVPEKLTVQEILDANLGRAWLAYLSACSTAQNKVSKLADEDLHLASSFQVAGYGHVVASMWPSNDAICAQVARSFYRRLMAGGQGNNSIVATALHAAVWEIRSQNIDRPYLWAQYIHSGA